jgi:hypothetical protein
MALLMTGPINQGIPELLGCTNQKIMTGADYETLLEETLSNP